ncbi:MAG TPA: protein kinase [Chthonomonadaceae bacterium]|nr:protein kinase [Chthonomonadaceae bacterium]
MLDVIKGQYQIVREIARSNDIVYEAMDTRLRRRIALKELNIAPSMTGQARRERIERFNREARAAARLTHPNIVSVFDFGEENGRHFIAMEFLEGQSLRDAMQARGALPQKEALNIAYQILDALAYAHSNKVIHRDIKPDNIHILPGGQAKLTDFGIARLTEEPALTSNGQVFGTPSYMSPEQIEGKHIDHRSDLFSMGVLLYEMLSGRKPFVGDSVIAITYAIMNAAPQPLSGIPAAIEQVIHRALGKRPDQRYATAEQMKADLQRAEYAPATFSSPYMAPNPVQQTGMGGFGYPGAGVPLSPPQASNYGAGGYTGQNYGYGGMSGGYTPTPPPMSSMPVSQSPAGNGNLPWAFNSQGNAPPAPPPVVMSQSPAAALPSQQVVSAMLSNPSAYAAPPYPAQPSAPAMDLSPGVRSLLWALLIAVLLGGGLAVGVIAFQNSFENYQQKAIADNIAALSAQGKDAYDKQDFGRAKELFEKALASKPGVEQRKFLNINLAFTYMNLAQIAAKNNDLTTAQSDYKRALDLLPDDEDNRTYRTQAYQELANVEKSLNLPEDAKQHQEAAQGVASGGSSPVTGSQPPPTLPPLSSSSSSAPSVSSSDNSQGDPNFTDKRRQEAQQLIAEGDRLKSQGDYFGAIQKWTDAVTKAPGSPESQEAQNRILNAQNSSSPPNPGSFGGYGSGD